LKQREQFVEHCQADDFRAIALARFISDERLFARLSLILGSGIGNGTKERSTVTSTTT